jgi:hypothetical protein
VKRHLEGKSEEQLVSIIALTEEVRRNMQKQQDTLRELLAIVMTEFMFRKGVMKMSGENPVIEWTPDMLKDFCRAYAAAVEAGSEEFEFDGNPFLAAYAKYLIEYLGMEFGKRGLVDPFLKGRLIKAKNAKRVDTWA